MASALALPEIEAMFFSINELPTLAIKLCSCKRLSRRNPNSNGCDHRKNFGYQSKLKAKTPSMKLLTVHDVFEFQDVAIDFPENEILNTLPVSGKLSRMESLNDQQIAQNCSSDAHLLLKVYEAEKTVNEVINNEISYVKHLLFITSFSYFYKYI